MKSVPVQPAELIERRRHLPKVDPQLLRHDIDDMLNSTDRAVPTPRHS